MLDQWAYRTGVQLSFIRPGKPNENAYIESFHDKLRDECLNRELFGSLREAQVILEQWRREYNEARPHSSLGYLTPMEYAEKKTNTVDGGYAPPNPAPLAAAGVQGEPGATAPQRQPSQTHNINQPAEL